MPLSEEDLKFVLTVDPDTSAVEKALALMGKTLDEISDQSLVSIVRGLQNQQEEIKKINNLVGQGPDVLKKRVELDEKENDLRKKYATMEEEERRAQLSDDRIRFRYMEDLDSQLRKQVDALKEARALQDPKALADRLAKERQISEARKEAALIELKVKGTPESVKTRLDEEKAVAQARRELARIEAPGKHEIALATIKEDTDPTNIAEQAKRNRELADSHRQLAEAQAPGRHAIALDDITSKTDPTKVREELQRSKEIAEAQRRLSEMQAPGRHEMQVTGIEARMDPNAIRRQVSQELGIVQLNKDLADLTKDEQRRQLAWKDPRVEITRELNNSLKDQEDTLIRVRALQDPDLMAMQLQINKQQAEIDHERLLTELRLQGDPAAIKDRVDKAREELEIRKATADAEYKANQEAQGGTQGRLKNLIEGAKQAYKSGGAAGVAGAAMSGGAGGEQGEQNKADVITSAASGHGLTTIGSTLGTAIGGPVGGALGVQLAKMIPDVIAGPAKAVASSLSLVSNSLRGLQGTLGPIGVGFDLVTAYMKNVGDSIKKIPIVGEVLGPFVDALTVIPGILKDITETLVGFAAKASPGQFKMFQIAIEDVQGVIGQAFLPVLGMMRDGIRLVGDTLATILPSSQEVFEALSPLRESFSQLGSSLRDLLGEIGPVMREGLLLALNLLSTVLSTVISWINLLAKAINFMAAPLRLVLGLFGMGIEKGTRTSVGAAARPAEFSGFEEYQKKMQLAAFTEPGKPKAEDMPTTVKSIEEKFDELLNWASQWVPDAILDSLADVLKGLIPDVHGATAAAAQAAPKTTGVATGALGGLGGLL